MSEDEPRSDDVFNSRCIRGGTLLAMLAVMLGAFAAHGLDEPLQKLYAGQTKERLGETVPAAVKYLEDFKTAADYQMAHSLALILTGLWTTGSRRGRSIAAWSFVLGIILFSGSLYALVLTGITKLGMITPLGGVAFLVGWGALMLTSAARRER